MKSNIRKLTIVFFLVNSFNLLAFAEPIKKGKIIEAVGMAYKLNNFACEIVINNLDEKSAAGVLIVDRSAISQKKLEVPFKVSRSERYVIEKVLGFEYASHQSTYEKQYLTDISKSLNIKKSDVIFTEEYRRKDSSLLYSSIDYYKFSCQVNID